MNRFALVTLFAFAACSADEQTAPRPRVELPGTLWYMQGTTLMRTSHGVTTAIAHDVYPSANALPDGRIVAIASKGDGETGEQLALVSPGGRITRFGPIAAQVRDPAVLTTSTGTSAVVVALNIDGHSDLYRVGLDGETSRLTDDAAGNYHPTIAAGTDSHAGAVIYVSSRDGDAEIYKRGLLNESSFNKDATRLTAFHKDDFDPVPSPDGQTIVFSSDREGPVRLFAMASDGTNLRRVTERTGASVGAGTPGRGQEAPEARVDVDVQADVDVDESDAVWSRDGSMLAYVAGGRVFVRSGGMERVIGDGILATFSPDGRWLAVATANGTLLAFPLNGGDAVPVAQGVQLVRWF